MKLKTAILLLALLFATGKVSNSDALMQGQDQDDACVTLVFCGDLMQHMPQVQAAAVEGGYDYADCFRHVAPLWQDADWVVANLETTLSDSRFSGYPQFRSPWQLARDARDAGINVMTTSNNHSCDKGAAGIRSTIQYLDSLGILHTGTFADSLAFARQTPLMLNKNGFRIALLNYTYGTNGIDIPAGTVVSLIDTTRMAYDIALAGEKGATNIIAAVHWGEEYHTKPSSEQRRLAAWLHEKGVDMVIGSHPHVVQPWEYHVTPTAETTGVTVYSLGNFVSNQRKFPTYGGICIKVTINRFGRRTDYRMEHWSNYVSMDFDGAKYAIIPETLCDSLPAAQQAEFRRLIEWHEKL